MEAEEEDGNSWHMWIFMAYCERFLRPHQLKCDNFHNLCIINIATDWIVN